jgi:hypothetical protein
MISDSESDKSGNEQKENINTGFGEVSYKFVWKNTGSFPLHKKHFTMCTVPKFYSAELDVVNEFENNLMQLLCDSLEMKPRRKLSNKFRSVNPFTFHSSGKMLQWPNVRHFGSI